MMSCRRRSVPGPPQRTVADVILGAIFTRSDCLLLFIVTTIYIFGWVEQGLVV
jgi:hypothetical protein